MKRGLLSFFLCACCLLSILGQEGYPAIDNDYVPTHHTIRKDYAVGQIDLSSGISSTGAKTYTVPIATYPGIRNLNPGLALTYNSQQGNGLIGVGCRWPDFPIFTVRHIPSIMTEMWNRLA